jgi:uncharacterized membrane protein YphA (DoxX/SURF4 family)
MKTVIAFWTATVLLLSGLLFWRNKVKYPTKRVPFLILKSATELSILMVSAIRLPMLLCAWISLWITRPIKAAWLRTTVGVLVAIGLGYLCIFAMELVLLLSVFSIDEITGEKNGFLGNLARAHDADKRRTELARAA